MSTGGKILNENKDPKTGKYIGKIQSLINIDEVKLLISQNFTLKNIANKYSISPEGLRKFLIKNNIFYKKKLKYISLSNFFDSDNEKSFYWAGFIAADGSISNKSDFSLSLSLKDIDHLYLFKKYVKTDAPIINFSSKDKIINGIKIKSNKYVSIRFRNKKWLNSFKRFNIIPNKTKVYTIPEQIAINNNFRHFIRGYFDGDGWFSTHKYEKNKEKINWGVCGNLDVILRIKKFLGENCEIEGKPQIIKQKNIYKLIYSNQNDVCNIVNLLWNDSEIYLLRKKNTSIKAFECKNSMRKLFLDKNILLESLKRLKSMNLVAKELKCSKSSIFNYCKKYKLEY